jgi:hypothetical protein
MTLDFLHDATTHTPVQAAAPSTIGAVCQTATRVETRRHAVLEPRASRFQLASEPTPGAENRLQDMRVNRISAA